MKGLRRIVLTVVAIFSIGVQASVVGISMHPFESQEKLLNAEFTSKFSHGSANGLQARYLHVFTSKFNADAGFRVFKNDFSTLFAGATYEFFPDHGNQPKIAGKIFIERERDDGTNINNFGIAPTISKGYSFWGYPAYPYVAVPVKLSLIEDTDKYEMVSSLNIGVSGNIPYEGFRNVLANIEANIDIENSYSYLSLGLSMNFL